MKRDACLIVDPDSTGVHLGPALRKLGVWAVAGISSTGTAPDTNLYDQLVDVGDASSWPQGLDARRVLQVVAGSDPGVLLADRLAKIGGIPYQNIPDLSLARRDKWAMGEALRNAGIPYARQSLLKDMQSGESWIADNPGMAVAIKPRQGQASDQVILCHSDAEIRSAVDALLGTFDFFGNENTTALIQEFLRGEEFMVDTVSRDGIHYVTGTWQSWRKRSGTVMPLQTDAIDPQSPEAQQIISYCRNVLDAVGIHNGPAHTEIMLVPDRGPVLIEVNARFHGSLDLEYSRRVFGIDQVTETALSIANKAWRGPIEPLQLKRFGRKLHLHSPISGIATRTPDYSGLEQLGSFHSIRNRVAAGKSVQATVSLSTCPATLFLTGESEVEIITDTQKARELQASIFNNKVIG